MIMTVGIPKTFTLAIMAVFVASFAGTTLDTATRIQRYVIGELGSSLNMTFLTERYTGTLVAVGSALVLAFATGASGNGALKLWPLFGAVNQTLAALALIIITLYLKAQGRVEMARGRDSGRLHVDHDHLGGHLNQFTFGASQNLLLQIINFIILVIAVWIAIEGAIKFFAPQEGSKTPAPAAL